MSDAPSQRPRSATLQSINWIGVACFLVSVWLLRDNALLPDGTLHPDRFSDVAATLIACASFAVPIIVLEFLFLKTYRSPGAGLDWSKRLRVNEASIARVAVKLVGLWTTFAIIALIYLLFPEYQSALFDPFWSVLRIAIPAFLLISPAYFFWIDGRMEEPRDGYWHLGALMLGWSEAVDLANLRQFGLGWLVKAFFLPLMFSYFHGNINHLRMTEIPTFTWDMAQLDIIAWQRVLYDVLILVDVGVIVVGYTLTVRLFDSHIRSTEPTWSGWIPAIICYQPFWGLIGPSYFSYRTEVDWTSALAGHPILQAVFAVIILALMGVYTWASVSFGLRFSNLTHRGIITNGPYRWCKHPAYLSKNLSWWFESLPFIAPFLFGFRGQGWGGHWSDALGRTLRLLGVNLIYYVRARTEERHLSHDPLYVRYAMWMESKGLMAWVPRFLRWARYAPPRWWLEEREAARIEQERKDLTPGE